MAKKESWLSLPVRLSQEVDRLFNELIYRPWGFNRTVGEEWNPQLDLYETDTAFILEADLPGVKEKDVSVEVENHELVLQGQRSFERVTTQDCFHCSERRVAEELAAFTTKQAELMRELAEEVRQIERRFGEALLTPRLAEISQEMDNAEVNTYLAEVKNHIIENLDDFKESESGSQAMPFPLLGPPRERDPFLEYDVNVVVDNSHTKGAPVIVESAPTYLNLFGTIERVVDRFGRLITNFTRIKSGSLVRAHGGYLIFSLDDALTEVGVWKALKRTLKSGRIEIETYEPFALFATSGLKPEPIEIRTKVIVVGTPFLYHLLYTWDEEFREIFKVHADFRRIMELDAQHLLAYGRDKPLALSASLCFEQSYSGVEGDSASSTELYALLSRLAELPVRQDLAVTGSVNQWGEVQAIGGVYEKVEGFFDVYRVRGLTGTQGVMIPAANVRNLVLRPDVIEAVENGSHASLKRRRETQLCL